MTSKNKYLVSVGMGMTITGLIELHYSNSHIPLIIAIVIGAVCIICGMVGVFDTE